MQLRPSQLPGTGKRGQGRGRNRPWVSGVILLLLLINIAVFGASLFAGPVLYDVILGNFAVQPLRVLTENEAGLPGAFQEVFTYVSHAFLHADLRHLGLNMMMLWLFGQPLAIRFGTNSPGNLRSGWYGGFLFLAFYLSAAVFSAILFTLFNLTESVLLIGASGAVSAVAGAAIRVMMRRYQPGGLRDGKPLHLTDWKVIAVTLFYVAANLVVLLPLEGWGVPGNSGEEVAWEVHIAGFAYGLLMFGFFDRLSLKNSQA